MQLFCIAPITALASNRPVNAQYTFSFAIPDGKPVLAITSAVAVDATGNIYNLDSNLDSVTKISPTGSN